MSVRSRLFGPPAPKMPPGLVELMDGLARDVLKNNPENVYEFCALHMQKLLEIRDGRAPKPLITLDQKIATAQKKVKERAERRQREYDEKMSGIIYKEQVLSTSNIPCSEDGSEEKKDIEKLPVVTIGEEQQNTIVTEEQRIENPTGLVPIKIDFDNRENEVVLNTYVDEEGEKDDNNSETFSAIDSHENEKYEMLNEENNVDYSKNGANCNSDGSTNHGIETEEAQAKDSPSNITKDDEDNGSGSLPTTIPETTIQLEDNENTEKEIVTLNKENILEDEDIEKLHFDSETTLQNETENEMNNTRDESINSTEKIHNNLEPDSKHDINTDQCEKQINESTVNDSVIKNCADSNIINEPDNNFTGNEAVDSNHSDKSQDEKILAVILGSENAELVTLQVNVPESLQSNELAHVQINEPKSQNNEAEQITEDKLDTESVLESRDDKTNNMNSSMDLETAAVTIQKVFRSFLFKTKTASYDDPTTVDINLLAQDKEKEENEVLNVKERRPLGISRMDTVLQTVNEEKSLSLSTDDSSTLSSAATIIQAHVRGFLVRNKYNLNKTISSNSLIDSDAPSIPSLEADSDNRKSKTVLNIHIVPEGGHFVSRDESILTSMDLSLDSSPPSSVNLHPLGYDKSERRKQLKREDAIQSVSPPSNNSGKLSEDHDSVKEVLTIDNNIRQVINEQPSVETKDFLPKIETDVINHNSDTVNPTTDAVSDEMDVVTPYIEDKSSRESDNTSKLFHSGEFHDIVLPTNVSRSDTSVVREFQSVLVYFILWNN